MGITTKKPEDMTWADIRATLAEAAALSKDNEKGLKELKESIAETNKAVAETNKAVAETNKAVAELTKSARNVDGEVKNVKDTAESSKKSGISMEELKATVAATSAAVADLTNSIKDVNSEVKGIAKSNKMISEDYFYESLKKSKTLGGIHFDLVEQDMKGAQKQKDGSRLAGQYDVVMINDNAVCIVEVKWRARKENILEIADKDADAFRTLFPRYENYQVYLAIAGMTFEKDVVDTAKELGMGILTFNGDAVEIHDKNLKAY